MSRKQQIIKLFFSNNYSKALQKKFLQWFTSSSDEKEKDDALHDLWTNLSVEADNKAMANSYSKTLYKINTTAIKKQRKPLLTYFSRAAVAILLVATSLTAIHYYTQNNKLIQEQNTEGIEFVEYFTTSGQTETVLLPDSTEVTMNSGTILIYPKTFKGKTRNVYLNGEAIFSVKKDESKLFIVNTRDIDIKVHGTVFNVSSYADSEHTSATLKSGCISTNLGDDISGLIVLNPGEQLIYDRQTKAATIKNVDVDKVFAWQEGSLIFQDMTIDKITKILERKYSITIYMNTDKYQKERITAKFGSKDNYEDILKVLGQIVPDFKYKIEDTKVYLY